MTREEIVAALRCAWMPVTERLPENAKHPGALCPVYLVATKYGVTEGWYNPDVRGWFIIVKRLTGLYDSECDINFEKGDVVRVEYAKDGIVTHWMPMPEAGKCATDALSAAADLIENQQRHIEALMKANDSPKNAIARRDKQIEDMKQGMAQLAKAVAVKEDAE